MQTPERKETHKGAVRWVSRLSSPAALFSACVPYWACAVLGLVVAPACGGGGGSGEDPKTGAKAGEKPKIIVSEQAKREHVQALDQFTKHEQAFNWSEGSCQSVAQKFVQASDQQKSDTGKALPTALYNAGVAYMRCGLKDQALEQFRASTQADPTFHRGRAQVALFEYSKTKNLDATIGNLETIIRDARFQNVEALVSVAALQMERGGNDATSDGANDFERAKKNIQRALAIDDSYMPAFNQLAIYYMESAKRKAGARKGRRRGLVVAGSARRRVNQQQLELAALVASQAIAKNPNYAPIHNTAGLIQVQMDNFNGAVKSFGKARSLDAKFFEAHMNYAAVNLSFRGFKEAQKAYQDALKLQPNDYEAHLGLALAYRGDIDDANWDQNIAGAQKHLDAAKKADPARAETYYNEAILTQEYRAKSTGDPNKTIPVLEQAKKQYEAFIAKASGAQYEEAVKVSRSRIQDIGDTITFIKEGEKMREEQEALDKAAKEAEEKAKAAESAPPPAAAPPAGDAAKEPPK